MRASVRLRGVAARLALPGCLAGLLACATARYVSLEPDSGVVAMPANAERHRERAIELIQEKCPVGYEIMGEEEVVIGAETRVWVRDREEDARATRRTRPETEWRIHFRCR